MPLVLPRLYVILDSDLLTIPAQEAAQQLAAQGVRLLQYRNKNGSARDVLAVSKAIVRTVAPAGVSVLVNDRPDIAVLAGAKGVHVGQDDLDVPQARGIVGTDAWVGVSTHNVDQFRAAMETSADYIAVGPVFATASKANPDPIVGIELIRKARKMTAKPIVAIGGITPERAMAVIEAGADSVAVISDVLRAADMGARVKRYFELLGTESDV